MNTTTLRGHYVESDCYRAPVLPNVIDLHLDHPIRLLEGIGYPLLLLLGTTGNLMNLLVLGRSTKKRRAADVFVMSMAASDLIILWLFVPVWIKKIVPDLAESDHHFVSFDNMYRGVYQWLTTTFYFISDWIAVVFSIERLLVVAMPLQYMGRFTAKRALIAVCAIVFIGVAKPVEFVVDYFSWVASGRSAELWPLMRPEWLSEWNNVQEVVIATDRMLGFSLLLTTNILLTSYLHQQQKIRIQHLQKGQITPRSDNNATILGRGCAIQCLIFKTPCFIYNSLLLASGPPFCTYLIREEDKKYWLAFVSFFLMINTSINFYLYCAFSQNFRQQLEAQFPCLIRKGKRLRNSGCQPKTSLSHVFCNNGGAGKRASDTSTGTQELDLAFSHATVDRASGV